MAQNKYFNITVLHKGTDITEFCSTSKFTALNRNLDCTQIFSKLNLKISLLAGVAFTIKEQDLFYVKVEDIAHYYRVTRINRTAVYIEFQLTNIFELLKNKRFYVGEEGSEIPNPLLDDYLNVSDQIITPNFNTLLRMICTLAADGEVSVFVLYSNDSRSYDYSTEVDTSIPNIGASISINADFVQWGKEITPVDLLRLLQLEYCFYLFADSIYDNGFAAVALPLMRIISDYTIPSGSPLPMPEFFRIDTVNNLLNPVKSLDKDVYKERAVLITEKKKGIEIKDASADFFKFEYRTDVETETIEYPDLLNLSIHFVPFKIQWDGSNYILKAGYYHAYHRYFSWIDITQDPPLKLDYQLPTGYYKQDFVFTNEYGQEEFTNPVSARNTVFDNENFVCTLTDNRIIERNNLRG